MTVSLESMLARFSPKDRALINSRAKELIAEEMTLRDLRKAHALTQERMAKLLGVKQESVSNIEKRSNLLLSTLRDYVTAMGGDLKLVVSFPDRPPVALKTLSDALDFDESGQSLAKSKRAAPSIPSARKRGHAARKLQAAGR